MMPTDCITGVESFAELGMHERARAELEELPPDARTDSRLSYGCASSAQ
jgi:hypothetical protein